MNLTTSQDFWTEMVEPDCDEYRKNIASLRYAFHSASSLFHLHDWIFYTDQSTVKTFTYLDKLQMTKPVTKPSHFANHLEQLNSNFGLIRGVANAAKHLVLTTPSPVQNSPSNAANTQVQSTGYGVGPHGVGPYGGSPRVVIQAQPDNLEYLDIMDDVFKMWLTLKAKHRW